MLSHLSRALAAGRRVTSPVLVGRAGELARMDESLARVRRHSPATLLIAGEPGAGKSRLVSAFGELASSAAGGPAASSAADVPARVLTGECPEAGPVGVPFAPFSAVLADITAGLGSDGVAALLPGGARSELTRLLPDWAGPASAGDPGEARARLFGQMLSLLRRLAERGPVILAIEDAQWADESSRSLLGSLIGSQRMLDGVLIIVTYRSDELHRCHPLHPLLAMTGRLDWVQRIELSGLSREESGGLIGRIRGVRPDSSLIDAVYRRTAGNPLFIEELLCCGCEHGGRTAGSPPLPPGTLRDLLVAAVRRLPEDTQEVLRAASAGGQRTGRALLAAVTGADADTLAAALRPAVEAGMLIAGQEGWAFRHALIGEAIHQDLLPDEHTTLHHRFATALQADPALVPAGRAAIEQAQHCYHAHDPALALSSAWRAAAEAGRVLAHAVQLSMLARVLELWRCVPDAQQRTGADHAAVLEQAAAVATAAGESRAWHRVRRGGAGPA
jgi:hypothetical protein